MRRKLLLSSVMLLFFTGIICAQITGKVMDDIGPLVGAVVKVKGTNAQVETNENGAFSIKGKVGDVLSITSASGLTEKTFPVTKLKMGVLKLLDNEVNLDVVIGYGTQKKVSVTGAITSIKGADLEMASSSLTNSFAGKLAGVISNTTSGVPGSASDFYIRGISTFGGRTTPLIMLDDVEISPGDLNNIPAETIESFSILKDASATAIYGSRGANGVMLVKTKSGNRNEKTRIGVTIETSMNTPVNFPNFVDGPTWMELYNEALLSRNPAATPKYTQEVIDATRSGINPYVFPNVNWKEVMFRDMAINQRANINIQGGGQKATYYMSIQANHDNGLLQSRKLYSWDNNINNWGYNFQNNISYNLLKGTKIDLRMNAQIRQYEGGNYAPGAIFGKMLTSNPINFPIFFPEREGYDHFLYGSSVLTGNTYRENPYASMLTSFKETRANTLNTSLKLNQNLNFITKGLRATALVNFKNWSQNYYTRSIQPYLYHVKDGSYDPATNEYELERLGNGGTDYINQGGIQKTGDQIFVLQATLNYSRKFRSHGFNAMLLYKQREFKNDVLPHRNQGYSGRLMYDYNGKYFAEFNFGYTGTERLSKGTRFEFFPAASAGWVVSREDFFAPVSKVVSFFKLRGSYGLIGSDETGLGAGAEHFLYIDRITLNPDDGHGYRFTTGENLGYTLEGPEIISLAVSGARWEKVKKLDIGTDITLFNNFNITADYFMDHRYDILLKREAWPQSLGYNTFKPWANKGKVDNWGFEVSTNYRAKVAKDLSIVLKGNFTYTQNKYIDIDDPIYLYPWQSRTGFPLSYTSGFIAEGLFTSEEEIANSPKQNLGSAPKPGDIKYRDITGDGVIDNDDKTMISPYGRRPRIQYGFGFNVFYKKFDFNVFFNGSAKRTIMTGLMSPFGQNDNNVFQYIADNRWSLENPDPNAKYPRLGLLTSDTQNNNQNSTYWMRDGSFLRFTTLEIGYKFKQGRVYITGNNLALFSKFKQWDPELSWNTYPLQRVYSVGVKLHF